MIVEPQWWNHFAPGTQSNKLLSGLGTQKAQFMTLQRGLMMVWTLQIVRNMPGRDKLGIRTSSSGSRRSSAMIVTSPSGN